MARILTEAQVNEINARNRPRIVKLEPAEPGAWQPLGRDRQSTEAVAQPQGLQRKPARAKKGHL